METRGKRWRPLLLALLVTSSLLLIALIFTDWLPWLRGPAPETSEWYWPYLLRPFGRWWAPVAAAVLLWGVGAWWLWPQRPSRRRTSLALAALVAVGLLLQLALVYADRPDLPAELVDRTLSNLASGYFEPAAEIGDMGATLRSYPQQMPTFVSEHARTHPPGLILANWLTIQALTAAPRLSAALAALVWPQRCIDLWLLNRPANVAAALGVWSLLPLLAAALTPLPAYGLARRLFGKDATTAADRAARLATLLAATIPALLLFAPKVVQFYAPLALLFFWALHLGLEKRAAAWLLAAGLLLSLMTFLSLGNAALLLAAVVYALLVIWPDAETAASAPRLLTLALAFALGAAAVWLLYWLGWGVAPWAIAQTGLDQHYTLVTNLRRYEWWVVWNLLDLALFGGWPTVLGWLAAVVVALRRAWRRALTAVDALAVALLVLVVVLDVSGSARGEVGRLWLFFMPLLTYPAARFWTRALPDRRSALLLVALQLAITVSLGLAWRPVRAVIVVAQEPAMPADAVPQTALDVAFAGAPIRLAGYTVADPVARPGGALDLTLFWQAGGAATRPYTVFTQLLDASGALVAQQDNWPVNGQWPPTCWRAGDAIVDPYRLALPADLPPGDYRLVAGLYDAQSGARLLTQNGADYVPLTTITVQD